MSVDDEQLEAYISDELDPTASAALEADIRTDAGTRELVADHIAVDSALGAYLGEDNDQRDQAIMGSVTSHITAGIASSVVEAIPTLHITSGAQAGRTHRLTEERLVLGRSTAAGLTLADKGASREHAVIVQQDVGWTIKDLGSANGIAINDQDVDGTHDLQFGDRIRIGQTEIAFTQAHRDTTFRLLGVEGPAAGRELSLIMERTTVGRGQAAHYTVEDKAASRENTAFIRDGVGISVVDLGSANGTLVNGLRITAETALHPDDEVRIGTSVFAFIDGRLDDLAGTYISGYQLKDRVGAGSVGVVYQARNTDTDQPVAVKFFDPRLTRDTAGKARLLNAARALQRLDHPNLLPVIDEGTHGKLTYVVTPWVANGSLRDMIIDSEDLPPAAIVIAISVDAARGLQAASSAGLVHRGLRAGDILIDDDGVGVVGDLGIAEPAAHLRDDLQRAYHSTEELQGGDPDILSNQCGLGLIMAHALCGKPISPAQMSTDYLRQLNPKLAATVATVIATMAHPDSASRYEDWDAVVDALDGVLATLGLADLPLEAEGPSSKVSHANTRRRASERRPTAAAKQRRATDANRAVRRQPRRSNNKQQIPQAVVLLVGVAAVFVVGLLLMPLFNSSGPRPRVVTGESDYRAPEVTGGGVGTNTWNTTSASGSQTDETLKEVAAEHRQRMANEEEVGTVDVSGHTPTSAAAPPLVTQQQAPPTPEPEPTPPAEVVPPTPTPEPAPVATVDTTPKPEPTPPPVAIMTKRTTPLVHFARKDTWESGALVLLDGSELKGSFKDLGSTFRFRPAVGDERSVPHDTIDEVQFNKPTNLKINTADRALAKKEFDKALEYYGRAKEDLDGEPYLTARIHEAKQAKQDLAEAEAMIANGAAANDHSIVLDGLMTYIRVMEPKRLDKAMTAAFESAYGYEAIAATESQRAVWLAAAETVKVDLSYDPEAPAKLAAAMRAHGASEDAKAVATLFETAQDARARFNDEAWMAYADVYKTLGEKDKVKMAIRSLTPTRAQQRDVLAMMELVGLRPPALNPELLFLSYIGGADNDAIQSVGFSATGMPEAKGNGFSLIFNPATRKATVTGAPTGGSWGEKGPSYKPPLSPQSVTVPETGETLTIKYKQVHGILQQPFLNSSAGWKMWGWSKDDAESRGLMADSRGYDIWLMPDGKHVGVMCWTDGGNSVLGRHPKDLDKKLGKDHPALAGCYSNVLGGMSTMIMKIDAVSQEPVGLTYISSHVFKHTQDAWGRFYAGKQMSRKWAGESQKDHFGLGETIKGGGLFVLDNDLKTNIYHAKIGGSDATRQDLSLIAVHGNLCILGGHTDAKTMKTVNAVQDKNGGGSDACVAVIKLW